MTDVRGPGMPDSGAPVFSEAVMSALRLAAAERAPGFPVATGRVLAALSRVDLASDWQRIWLHSGDPVLTSLADAPDDPLHPVPSDPSGNYVPASWADEVRALGSLPKWEGVPITERLSAALELLGRICTAYRLLPAPSGALALALLADPGNGAAGALLCGGMITHAQLLDLVQADLLDTHLEGVESLLPPTSPVRLDSSGSDLTADVVDAHVAAQTVVGPGNSHGTRWPIWRWRLLSVACLLLIGIGLFWHRQFLPAPTQVLMPPYTVPAVAHQMLTTADLPPAGNDGWLQMQDGPPDNGLFVGTGRFRADLRQAVFVGAWKRWWETPDGQHLFQVEAIEGRDRFLAVNNVAPFCQPKQGVTLPGAQTAGYLSRDQRAAEACALVVRGRTAILIDAWAAGPTASTVAWGEVKDGVEHQVPKVPATATNLPVTWVFRDMRTAINSTLMDTVLGIPILLGLFTAFWDPSSWRRLRSRFTFLKAPQSFSVDGFVTARLTRQGALALLRLAWLTWTMRATEDWHLGGFWQSGGLLAGAIASMLAIEWLIRRRQPVPQRPAVFSGGRWIIGAVSLVFSAAIAGAGVFLIFLGALLYAFGSAPDGLDFLVTELGRILPVAGVILILLAVVPFMLARRIGMRSLRVQANAQRTPDEERHPVLLLRSFADDQRRLRARRLDRASIVERLCMRHFERLEEVTASALAVYAPVLALSPGSEKLPPPLGAERRRFTSDDTQDNWQIHIKTLISSAQLICVTMGRSHYLQEEIKLILRLGALNRAIFVLPPTRKREQRRRLAVLAATLNVDPVRLDQTWPGSDVLAVAVPDGATPVVITGRAQDDVGYEAAIGAWAIAATRDTRSFPADLRQLSALFADYAASDQTAVPGPVELPKRQPLPPVVYPKTKTPAYKPWIRRMFSWRLLPFMLLVVIFPLIGKVAHAGGILPTAAVDLKYPAMVLARDAGSGTVYAVLDGRTITTVDLQSQQVKWAADTAENVQGLVVSRKTAYYTSYPFKGSGHVGRVNLSTGRMLWDQPVPTGTQSPILTGNRVIVVSPATGQVLALATATGRVVARRSLAGTPMDVAESNGRLYVVLARSGEIAELNPQTLATETVVTVPSGPRQIFTDGHRVWVLCLLAHKLVSLGPAPQPSFTLSDQEPLVSSSGGWLAIEGQEWVTELSPAGSVTRIPVAPTGFAALLTRSDGSVIVSYDSGIESGRIAQYGPVK